VTEAEKRVSTWRYVVPNAITSASLLVGLLAILHAVDHRFIDAAWLIVLSVLLDKLDGTFARLLKATSRFGVQMDSLTDFVTFGIAPGVTLLLLVRDELTVAPWNTPLGASALYGFVGLYVVCSALRLAKFNVMSERARERERERGRTAGVFFGMPTTYAGGVLALLILMGLGHHNATLLKSLPLVAVAFGLLMVSTLPLPKVGRRGSTFMQVFQAVNLVACYACGVLRIYPEYLLLVTLGYGLVGFAWGHVHRKALREEAAAA
jgi:CDP-diacylglycerol--serine O-phosphatidyltransferase